MLEFIITSAAVALLIVEQGINNLITDTSYGCLELVAKSRNPTTVDPNDDRSNTFVATGVICWSVQLYFVLGSNTCVCSPHPTLRVGPVLRSYMVGMNITNNESLR